MMIGLSYGVNGFRTVVEGSGEDNYGNIRTEAKTDTERDFSNSLRRWISFREEPTPTATSSPTATPTKETKKEVVPTPTATPAPVYQERGNIINVYLTYYTCPPFCGTMANGQVVYEGAIACGGYFYLDQRVRIKNDPTLRTYVCADTGRGGYYWIDVFFADYAAGKAFVRAVGDFVTVEIVN